MGFVHLHIHSEYSLLKGVCRIDELVEEAKNKSFRALALTDQNVLYGVIPFYKACRKANIQPIIGMELHLIEEMGLRFDVYEILLLAKNEIGYRHLLALSTEANIDKYRVQGTDKETLFRYAEGLIAVLNFRTSDVSKKILEQKEQEAEQLLRQYQHYFGNENVFLEIQNHFSEDERKIKDLYVFSEKVAVPLVATNHVHFTKREEYPAYQVIQAIRKGRKLQKLQEEHSAEKEYYLKSADEMDAIFATYQEALQNSEKIAEMCQVEIPLGDRLLPKYPVPNGESANSLLEKLCEEGLLNRYITVTPKLKKRLDYELSVIKEMGFSDYFLIVWDFMQFARKNKMVTGPGRGSAAGSLVAYVLQITDVDPIKYDLLFERFLNPERVTMPDIDIDFPDHRREEVIEYVQKKYGANHVAQITTFGTFAAKAAIRDVGKVLEADQKLIDQLASFIPNVPGIKLNKVVQENKELEKLLIADPVAKQIFFLATMIEGLPRHTSTHAAGVVISSEPLIEYVPLQSGQGTFYNTQFTMDILEEIGLLKMDFLGLRNLTLIENILKYIRTYVDDTFQLDHIAFDDERTFRLLSSGETTGIFQLESEGMKRVLVKLKPTHFEDIVAVNALYRPGPMEFISDYIEAKHGRKKVTYPHSCLEPILQKTYGVIVYQEQIMQIAAMMAGFTLGEADLLRRAVGKKKRDILEKERNHFINGAKQKGFLESEANYVYDMIVRFADYGFNRSHAVAYSMISYKLAYLKANYPLAFYSSLLTSAIYHQEKLQQYVSEAKRFGINILPPSINKSNTDFTIENKQIRFALAPIRNLGQRACYEIETKRKSAPFKNIFDFCKRIDLKIVTRRGIEALILAGCFDETNENRATLLASLQDAIEYGQIDDENALFQTSMEEPKYEDVPPFSDEEKRKFEKEVIGFYLSSHPVESYKPILLYYKAISSHELAKYENQTVFLAGLVESLRRTQTKKGESMAFAVLSDEYGMMDVVIFPKQYQQFYQIIKEGQLLFIEGTVKKENNKWSVIFHRAKRLQDIKMATKAENKRRKVFLRIEPQYENSVYLEKIKNILINNHGNDEVYLHYTREKKTIRLSEKYYVNGTEFCLQQLQKVLGAENVAVKRD